MTESTTRNENEADRTPPYSRDDCIAGLHEAAEIYGDDITATEYRESGIKPSDRTLTKKFGSWNEAKAAAGLETRGHGVNRKAHQVRMAMDTTGHMRLRSEYDGKRERVSIARLLAVAEYGYSEVCENIVHHIDHIPWDNRPNNIMLMGHGDHARHHRSKEASYHDYFDPEDP